MFIHQCLCINSSGEIMYVYEPCGSMDGPNVLGQVRPLYSSLSTYITNKSPVQLQPCLNQLSLETINKN